MQNLNATIPAKVYPRLMSVTVRHLAENTFEAVVTWQPHIRADDGTKYNCGPMQTTTISINPQNVSQQIQLRHPITGESLNATMTYGQLIAGFYSAWIQGAGFDFDLE
jgi:hypothetical protein